MTGIDPIRVDQLREQHPAIFEGVCIRSIAVSPQLVRLLVHWLGDLIKLKQLPGQAGVPEGLVAAQHALAEAYAASGSRRREESPLAAAEFVNSGHEYEWVGTDEAAAELGITADGVRWNCRRGNLERRTVGRQMLISRSSIENYKHRKAERTA